MDLTNKRVLSVADIDVQELLYQPKSELTAAAYGLILRFVRNQLGFLPNSIINGTADEVIAAMKNHSTDEYSRRQEITALLTTDPSGLNDDDYAELSNLCKKIDDWDGNQAEVREDIDEENAQDVGLNFVDDDDDEGAMKEYTFEVQDSDDEVDSIDSPNAVEKQLMEMPTIPTTQIQIPSFVGDPVLHEGYQEYTIKPRKHPMNDERLIKVDELSDLERIAYGSLKNLNPIQTKIYRSAMTSDKSLLVCAPTGAGKTTIALMTMLREILKHKRSDGKGFDTSKFKIIYIAPIKALVQEIVENFRNKFKDEPFCLKVEELTGDHQLAQKEIARSQIIVCTPEKWDIVTRKSLDRLYTKIVKLVIFDEIHLLHNERGATLEALVARIKRHKKIEGENIRIIGLSATLPNYKDVARFIAPESLEEDSTFYFDSSYRPIPLTQRYIAIKDSKKGHRMINDILYENLVERLTSNAQVLVFVHSRPDTIKTAEFIKTKAFENNKSNLFLPSHSSVERIDEMSRDLDPKLREILKFGIGAHHAGMSRHDRSCVEELFKDRCIKVLVSTATLAWGVNLPARVVIIRGTQVYRDGKWTDLDSLDVTQMLGRAGRPGFDREGEGIVITQQSQVAFYMSIMNEQLPVESRLVSRLPEFVNAECVIGNIESLDDAINWLSETYLMSRMKTTNPTADLRDQRRKLAYAALSILDSRKLALFDNQTGAVKCTDLGRIASDYNCSSRTIKLFYDSIQEHSSDIELFRIFSLADEFKDIFVRKGEETDLQILLNQTPYPIDDKRASPGAVKVNALLQVYIFRLNIDGSDLICDMHFIRDNAGRLTRAIHEIAIMKNLAQVVELSLDLCRKVDKRMTVCHSPLRQFAGELDLEIINRIERKRNFDIEELKAMKPEQLSELLRCDKHVGESVHYLLDLLPRLKIEFLVKPVSRTTLKIDLSIVADFNWDENHHGPSERFWLLVEDVNQEVLLHHEVIHLRHYLMDQTINTQFYVPFLEPMHPFYYVRVLPDRWFGCDYTFPIHMERLLLPMERSSVLQLKDIELTSFSCLGSSLYEELYNRRFNSRNATLTSIQAETVNALYSSDEDVMLLASAGSGKLVCAEFAIIRLLQRFGGNTKVGYLAANKQSSEVVYQCWRRFFNRIEVKIHVLTGNRQHDSNMLARDDVNFVIGDAESWYALTLSGPKKFRKMIEKIQLFILDDVHMLHSEKGSIFEWFWSKIKSITNARIVAMGSPMVCADSLASWLLSSERPYKFNYHHSIRPVRLNLTIQKFHNYEYRMRLLTMLRPVYNNIMGKASEKPVLVFAPDLHQVMEVCDTIIRYRSSTNYRRPAPHRLELIRDDQIVKHLEKGVGYLHLGMDRSSIQLIEDIFDRGELHVLVVTAAMCWSISARSNLTIIMDTQLGVNGRKMTEYELPDVMQMVGLTGRTNIDHECECIIMCQSSRANYYDRFLNNPLPVESELPSNLATFINYEAATGMLTDLNSISSQYLKYSFFFRRIQINHCYYVNSLPENQDQWNNALKSHLNELVNDAINQLERAGFIGLESSSDDGVDMIRPEHNSNISKEFQLCYQTISNYDQWVLSTSSHVSTSELIEVLSGQTEEFRRYIVKDGEIPYLKQLNDRFKRRELRDKLHLWSGKTKLLILSQYNKTRGKEDPVEGELIHERREIISFAHRSLMAILQIAWLRDLFDLAKQCIRLAKKLCPFDDDSSPSIDMSVAVSQRLDDDKAQLVLDVTVERQTEPFSRQRCIELGLPESNFREEGWFFLVRGRSKLSKDIEDEFVLFQVLKKPPTKGSNQYILVVDDLKVDTNSYTFDLLFMSDFFSSSEDRSLAIDFESVTKGTNPTSSRRD